MTLPKTDTLQLNQDGPVLHITLNRPDSRNAMSLTMVNELMAVFEAVKDDTGVRAIVLRGAGGHFCAGGDIKDMAGARQQAASGDSDAFEKLNRCFGEMITAANHQPQGVIPAQIAPFVVERIGLTQARRLALTGIRFQGEEARRLGIVHEVAADADGLDVLLQDTLKAVRKCDPPANRVTKQLVLNVGHEPMDVLLDQAAKDFAAAVNSEEGQEGTMAFVQKRPASWNS